MSDTKRAAVDLRVLAALKLCASKEETRYYLCGVCLELTPEATTYVVTDGHRMVAARHEAENTLTGAFIIPSKDCGVIKPPKSAPDFIGSLQADGPGLLLTYGADKQFIRPIDGTFPTWRRVFPTLKEKTEPGQFDPHYLSSLQKVADALGLGPIALHPQGESSPALVSFSALDKVEVYGLLMPKRVSIPAHVPEWIQPKAEAA